MCYPVVHIKEPLLLSENSGPLPRFYHEATYRIILVADVPFWGYSRLLGD